jgi:hypothetical protein
MSFKESPYACLHPRPSLATAFHALQAGTFWPPLISFYRENRERPTVGLSDVRELSLARNRLYLPDGMPKGYPQWAMWWFDAGALLRG